MILSALSDIHLTIFMKPIPLTPLFAGYTVGIMPKNLDISAHHCAILTGFIAVSQLETLILCFARMHQVIALVLNTHVVPKFLQYSCYALCVLCPIALCGCIEHFHITQDQQWDYISETYPELIPEFQKLTHFVLYIKSCKLNHLLIAMILMLSEMFIAWFVSHSSINMIGLIIFFPPYQIFFLRVFKRKNSKHTTPVAVVPVVAAVSSGF
ncbi:Protein CBG26165 [Caenorhabditis briggsae]|uniref:Protein CBG26165 n=1 Tax=Caenorhabditis briggsae TaxID=6238 RepID=B6ILA1_CAEBR|nr:Protein CBG26165 [Caenorhabditis briggsae]CAS00681.1 Protein CBG26165 [Caenorhabditis briggsae]